MRTALRRGLAATALLSGVAVLGLTRDVERLAARVAVADPPRVAAREPSVLLTPTSKPIPRATEARAAAGAPEAEASTAPRLARLLARLARDLRGEPLHVPTWDTRLRAHARAFDRETLLAAPLDDEPLTGDEALVLTGLLGARQEVDRALFASVHPSLRERWRAQLEAAEDEPLDAPGNLLAFRAVAALGDDDDALRLWSLATGEGPASAAARRALERARQPRIVEALVAHAEGRGASAWTLPLLQRLAHRMDWALDDGLRTRTAVRLALLVNDEGLDESHRSQAALALGAWSPREAVLLTAAAPPDRPLAESVRVLLRSLAATDEADAAALLLTERLVSGADEDRLALAEDLAVLRRLDASHDGPLLALLEHEARASADPGRRRRALRSLRSAGDPAFAHTARAAAVDDPDPGVRGLAVQSLSGDDASTGLLERIAVEDPHPGVRRLASQALDGPLAR